MDHDVMVRDGADGATESSPLARSAVPAAPERQSYPKPSEHRRRADPEANRGLGREQVVADQDDSADDRDREEGEPSDREVVGGDQDFLLVFPAEVKPVVGGRRDQEG